MLTIAAFFAGIVARSNLSFHAWMYPGEDVDPTLWEPWYTRTVETWTRKLSPSKEYWDKEPGSVALARWLTRLSSEKW